MANFLQSLVQKAQRNVITPIYHDAANGVDVLNALRQGTQGLVQASTAAVTHNPVAERNAINKTNNAVNYSLGASRGLITPQQAQNADLFGNAQQRRDFIAPVATGVGRYTPYVVGGAGANLFKAPAAKILGAAGTNYIVGTGSNAAQQYGATGHVNLGQAAKAGLPYAAFGGVAEGVHLAYPGVKNLITNKPAKLPSNQFEKITTALPAMRKAGASDAQVKQILEQGIGSNRGANLRVLEQNQAKLTNADRLALTGGDTGQAGLQMSAADRNAMLARFKQQAAHQKPDSSIIHNQGGYIDLGGFKKSSKPSRESGQPQEPQLPQTAESKAAQNLAGFSSKNSVANVVENRLTKGGKAGRQNIGPDVQAQISGEHAVRNTQQLQNDAIAAANKQSLTATINDAHKSLAVEPGKINDQTVAQVQQAIERADAAGRTPDAVALHDSLSEHLTAQGQSIQAASLLYKLSPQGQLYKALRDLNKSGAKVSPEFEKQLRDLTKQIKQAKGDAKDLLMAKFHKIVADKMPQHLSNQLLSVWKAGLLSGVKTQGGNFTSNATFGTLHTISNPIAAGVDRLLSQFTGERTKVATARGFGEGAQQGLKGAAYTMRTGIDSRNLGGSKYDVHGELNFSNPIIQKVFGNPSNLVFRGMNAADQPFYYAALKNNLYDLAKTDAINKGLKGDAMETHIQKTVANPTLKMAETAKVAAQKSVLGEDSKLASNFSKFAQAHPSAQLLAPFVKVPTNFLTRTLDYTPVGAIKQLVKSVQSYRSGNGIDQRALSEAIGEATTGTALIYVGAELANKNLLSGQYPTGDQKETSRWKAEGITPNSIKVGNKWISLNYLGPVGLLFGAGKDFHDAAVQGNNGAAASIAGFGKNLEGQSFLTGFSGFANAINDPQRSAKSFINSEAGSIVPAWSNDTANSFDKYQRQADTPLQSIQSRLPVLRNHLPIKQDVYGNDLQQRTDPFNLLANPLKPSNVRGNVVINEVSRLHSVDPGNGDLQVTPIPVKSKLTVGKQKITLNSAQRYALQNQVGQATQNDWQQAIQSPQYQNLSDVQKANLLTKIRQDASALAQRTYLVDNNLATYDKALTKKQANLAQNNDIAQYFSSAKPKATTTKTSKTTSVKTAKAKTAKGTSSKSIAAAFKRSISQTSALNKKVAGAKVKKVSLNSRIAKTKTKQFTVKLKKARALA